MTRTTFVIATFLFAFVIKDIQLLQCPEKNGKFPIPDQCDAYIECINGHAEEKLCPDGLLFNENLSSGNGECQYAPSVNCSNRLKLQPPNATDDCPHQFGFYRIGDSYNCGEYMNCAHGVGKITKCPEGLAFNQATYRCDWPDQVEDCNAEEFLGFTCPDPVIDEKLLEEEKLKNDNETKKTDDLRYYKHPKSCKKYFVCVNNRPRLYSCGKYLVFNQNSNLCDFYTNVPECNLRIKKLENNQTDVLPLTKFQRVQKTVYKLN